MFLDETLDDRLSDNTRFAVMEKLALPLLWELAASTNCKARGVPELGSGARWVGWVWQCGGVPIGVAPPRAKSEQLRGNVH